MSQRWLKFLEKFGAPTTDPTDPVATDVDDPGWNGDNPAVYERYDVLFQLYGPLPDSPWVPYQCPTLFASIDRCHIRPKQHELSPLYANRDSHPADAWQWLGADTMVIVDLPGAKTIEAGVLLANHNAQFVSTFDHWAVPPRAMTTNVAINATGLIDAMYTLGPRVYNIRQQLTPDAAPVWLCDSRRLGGPASPTPGTFDNRYYIDDSILPGIQTMKKGGIRRLVYFNEKIKQTSDPDLDTFIIDAIDAGITLEQVALDDEESWITPRPMDVPFKTKLPLRGFRRSDMGGFGKMVPQPSEGSYSSGGRGG